MSPDDLVARLDQRFKLLTRGQPGRPRAAPDAAQHDRLVVRPAGSRVERRALNRLSVFAGGCDLLAAEAVLAGDELDAVEVDRRAGPAGRQVARGRRQRAGRRRRSSLPAAREHPPVRRGATARTAVRRPTSVAATPTTTWLWRRRPVLTSGAGSRSSGRNVVLRDTRQLPSRARLGDRDSVRRSTRSASSHRSP